MVTVINLFAKYTYYKMYKFKKTKIRLMCDNWYFKVNNRLPIGTVHLNTLTILTFMKKAAQKYFMVKHYFVHLDFATKL